MLLLVLIALFIVVPITEIWVIIQIGHWIGLLPTLGLMLLDAILGSMLMRSQGRAAWRRFSAALSEGRVPAREVFDGGLIIFGGALLMAPGFVTDIVGALFLAPPTRSLIRRWIARRVGRGLMFGVMSRTRVPGAGGGPAGDDRAYDIDGSAIEVPRRDLHR
jgi:UPF0716 protein FxsA